MAKSRIQKRSRLQESRAARDTGGRVQAGSGSSWRAKGDVRGAELRVECKYTEKPTYVLKLAELRKIQQEALLGGLEDWAMQVEFVVSAGSSWKIAIAPYSVMKEWWKQFGAGMLLERFTEVEAARTRIHVNEIWRLACEVATHPKSGWIWQYAFQQATGHPWCYGAMEWDLFVSLLEQSKEAA